MLTVDAADGHQDPYRSTNAFTNENAMKLEKDRSLGQDKTGLVKGQTQPESLHMYVSASRGNGWLGRGEPVTVSSTRVELLCLHAVLRHVGLPHQ